MAKLYSNENFPLPVVEELRGIGHDVLTIQESGKAGQSLSDEAVLEFARGQDRILLTFNRKHFRRLHHKGHEHCGIISCSVDTDFVGLALRIDEAIKAQIEGRRQLIHINRPSR